ncbi:hypothetical protein LQZ18_18350 [Lachnospiraceae bacterium ZAX-1]
MLIIDGHTGTPHISSQQVADSYMAIFGDGDYILDLGSKFSYEVISNNEVNISDGVLVMQGRRAITEYGTVENITIENGTQGATRKDLIVARYTRDTATLEEKIIIIAVKGTPNSGDPVVNDGTNVREGAIIHDMILYRVNITDIAITSVDTIFKSWGDSINTQFTKTNTELSLKANDSQATSTISENITKIAANYTSTVNTWIQNFANKINGIITNLGKKQDIYDYTVMQNKYDGLTLPSVWPSGQTLMFSNAQTNKFNGQNYCAVITVKSFSAATTSCVQYIYPYNVEFPITYRYALQGTDAWLAWRSIANADNPIFTGSISMGRLAGSTVGEDSVAVGKQNKATGAYSHAEGYGTSATGAYSHTEGHNTQATGNSSHAEGLDTIALNDACHSEGYLTTSGGTASHSEGAYTSSFAYQHAGGHYNNSTIATPSTSSGTGTGTSFVLGNGTSSAVSNAFRVTDNGQCFAKGAYSATGADYAEYFEWEDGNPENADRRGIFVTMSGRKIKPAGCGDYILGVVSANPCILGNADECYSGQFLFDDFGEYIYETSMVDEPYIDEDGEQATRQVESTHYKLNPEYDPEKSYVHRAERKEWAAVGMMGVLTCRHDGTAVVDEYVECSAEGVATHAETRMLDSYRVIEEIDSELCRVLIK